MAELSVPITAIILTYNEEKNLEPCLQSLNGWVGEVFVVDSGSTDSTIAIAERYDARVVNHPFETHARQWMWALESLPCRYSWILGLDADQRVTPDLRDEIIRLFAENEADISDIDGFYLNRRQIFRGRWIRHGGYYPKYLLKLFRRDKVRVDEGALVDHHFNIIGRSEKLSHDILEDNQKEADIAFWVEKHNRYARLQAREEFLRRSVWPIEPALFGTPDQRVLWFKRGWYGLPLYIRSVLYFLYRYFLRLGFLDGKQGFTFHFLQAFWYRLLVDVHLDELRGQRVSGDAIERPAEMHPEGRG